jgi:hypothetical protein
LLKIVAFLDMIYDLNISFSYYRRAYTCHARDG